MSTGWSQTAGRRVMQERFTFPSGGETLVGTLFLPAGEPAGMVVTSGPLTSVKAQAAGAYAKAMADRGFAAVAFDHRCFGESCGSGRDDSGGRARWRQRRDAATGSLRVLRHLEGRRSELLERLRCSRAPISSRSTRWGPRPT
jgi:alpha-beta hydrolase superfamily lysophospholipase